MVVREDSVAEMYVFQVVIRAVVIIILECFVLFITVGRMHHRVVSKESDLS